MAFFGLTDIKFNQIEPRIIGALSALEGSQFQRSALKYPIDVGSADKGHYMIFFVREQKNTQYSVRLRGGQTFSKDVESQVLDGLRRSSDFTGGGLGLGKSSFADTINSALTNVISKGTSSLTKNFGSGGVAGKIAGAIDGFVKGPQPQRQLNDRQGTVETSIKSIIDKNAGTAAGGFLTRTQLTTDAIALYMPDTLNFDSNAAYDSNVKPGDSMIGQALVAAPNVIERVRAGDLKGAFGAAAKSGLGSQLIRDVAEKSGVSGDLARIGAFVATGGVTNPMLEMLYTSPEFRSFQFEFMFFPRSEAEAYQVQKIIERFRFHQAPELMGGVANQTGLLIPPSEFDIRFYYAGRQNPNIPPIATCVLENIQINYAPRGFVTYESVGENSAALGRTGMPVAIQMSLRFKEITYITKEDFNFATSISGAGQKPNVEGMKQGIFASK